MKTEMILASERKSVFRLGTSRSETYRPGDLLRLTPGVGWRRRREWREGALCWEAMLIWGVTS